MQFQLPPHIIGKMLDAPQILPAWWEGREDLWEVQHHFDRPFFRLVSEKGAGPIWATLAPCEPDEIENHFRLALQTGEFGLTVFSEGSSGKPVSAKKANY